MHRVSKVSLDKNVYIERNVDRIMLGQQKSEYPEMVLLRPILPHDFESLCLYHEMALLSTFDIDIKLNEFFCINILQGSHGNSKSSGLNLEHFDIVTRVDIGHFVAF